MSADRATKSQENYIVALANKKYGTSYSYISQIKEGGIGKMSKKVHGLSKADASRIISELGG